MLEIIVITCEVFKDNYRFLLLKYTSVSLSKENSRSLELKLKN